MIFRWCSQSHKGKLRTAPTLSPAASACAVGPGPIAQLCHRWAPAPVLSSSPGQEPLYSSPCSLSHPPANALHAAGPALSLKHRLVPISPLPKPFSVWLCISFQRKSKLLASSEKILHNLAYTYPSSQFVPFSALLTKSQLYMETVFFLCFFLEKTKLLAPQGMQISRPFLYMLFPLLGILPPSLHGGPLLISSSSLPVIGSKALCLATPSIGLSHCVLFISFTTTILFISFKSNYLCSLLIS